MKTMYTVLTGLLLLFLLTLCKKEVKLPNVCIDIIRNVDTSNATLECTITDDGNGTIISRGVCWSTSGSPTVDGDKTIEDTDSLSFTSHITNLLAGTSYYFRAYATNSAGTGYGDTRLLGTIGDKPLIVDANFPWYNAYNDSAVLFLKINPKNLKTAVKIEYGETIDYGSIFNLPQNPLSGNVDISLIATIKGLKSGATYHWRASASNQKGTTYGKDNLFRTSGFLPYLSNQFSYKYGPKSVGLTLSISTGNLTTKVVFEWGSSINYGNSVNVQPDLSGSNFIPASVIITGLAPKTLYHFRVKATNNAGTVTGVDHTFTTEDWMPLAMLNTPVIQAKTAVLNGAVEPWGLPATVTFEWGRTTEYGNSAPVTITVPEYSQWADVSANISGLLPATVYFYALKITNEYGTKVREGTFTTVGSVPFAQVETAEAGVNEVILKGSVFAGFLPTTVTFEYGESGYDNSIAASQNPVTGNSQTYISASVSGLNPETNYTFRLKAQNELGTYYSVLKGYFKTYSVKDADGNFYHSVKIGTQTWLAENLKTKKYSNGDLIGTTDPLSKDLTPETSPKYQWPAGGNEANVPLYGRLYTWYAVTDSRKICPSGWHVPTNAEMLTLVANAGGAAEAGGRLKETGTTHWNSPNTGASDSYGFKALAAEGRTIDGSFGDFGDYAGFWSTTEYDLLQALHGNILYIAPYFSNEKIDKKYATTVRCIKD